MINESTTSTFTITNQSKTSSVRFTWPEHPHITFVPRTGHLHPGRSKEIVITLKASQPLKLNEQEFSCKIVRIVFERPVHEVSCYDLICHCDAIAILI